MKTIFNLLACCGTVASLAVFSPQAHAQKDQPEVGFVRIVQAVAPGEGNANILIDGEDIFPKGYKLGQRTGGFGLKAGAHTIAIKKTGVETGTTKITLGKGETISLVGFAEKVPPVKEDDPPVWKTKILLLKQSDPESGFRLALVSLCPEEGVNVMTQSPGKPPELMYAKRMTVVSKSLGKSKTEVVLKVAGETIALVAPEDPGNYVVILYQDEAGKVKALSFYDPKFVIAG
jgi:hypothetical protein